MNPFFTQNSDFEPQMAEQSANERKKNIRFESGLIMIFGFFFLSLANHSAICGSRFENDTVLQRTWNKLVYLSVDLVLVNTFHVKVKMQLIIFYTVVNIYVRPQILIQRNLKGIMKMHSVKGSFFLKGIKKKSG